MKQKIKRTMKDGSVKTYNYDRKMIYVTQQCHDELSKRAYENGKTMIQYLDQVFDVKG
jgi:hypothetical protein